MNKKSQLAEHVEMVQEQAVSAFIVVGLFLFVTVAGFAIVIATAWQ